MFDTENPNDGDIFGNRPSDAWGNTSGNVWGQPDTNVWGSPTPIEPDLGDAGGVVDTLLDWFLG